MSEWQDISTAPKNGTWFLGGLPGHEPVYCHFEGDKLLAFDWRKMPRLPTRWTPLPSPPQE